MTMINIQGKCPMGCGERLHLNSGTGMIVCTNRTCPRPSAVSDLLKDPMTDHKVEINGSGFAIKHPVYERIEDRLFECRLQKWLEDLDGSPVDEGVYRVSKVGSDVTNYTGPGDAVMTEGWLWESGEM